MEIQEIKKTGKNLVKYYCQTCDFKCCQKCDWVKHVATQKHRVSHDGNDLEIKKLEKTFFCGCGKKYKTNAGLWKHAKTCDPTHISSDPDSITDKELVLMLLKQQNELIKENTELRKEHSDIKELILEIVKNGTHHTTNTITHTNSHNKAFNLNFFLNETCKNAMDITDFVESIKLQLSDLIDIGKVGYVEGISKIIVKNLNNLDETERPIHCTDKKRETFYVKDQGQWEKEDDHKTKLRKFVQKVADKNIRLLPQFREKYPDYGNAYSRTSDIYNKMVIEAMETDVEKNDKIIRNISKATIIKEK